MPETIRILLIEDNPADARLIEEMFKLIPDRAFSLSVARHLAAGIDKLEQEAFDVVLLDLSLPDSLGIDSVNRVIEKASQIAVIILTGLDDEAVASEALRLGVQDYLVKGRVDPDILNRTVRYAIERNHAEQELRASESLYRMLFENAGLAISYFSAEGDVISINQIGAQYLDETPGNIVGLNFKDLMGEVEGSKYIARLHKCIEVDGTIDFEDQVTLPTGKKWFLTSYTPMKDAHQNVIGVQVISKDITESKEAEEALKTKDELIQMTSKLAKMGGWEFDTATMEGTWTDEVARIHEVDPDHQIDAKFGLSFYHGESRKKMINAIRAAVEKAEPYDLELSFISGKGKHKWVRTIGIPVIEEDKVVKLRGYFQDITEQKIAQDQLKESYRTFETLLSNLPGMAFRCLNESHWTMLFVSSGCYDLTGYHPDQITLSAEVAYADLIHPDDKARVWDLIQNRIRNGLPYELEYRIRTQTGDEKWVWERGEVVTEEEGEPIILEGFIADITERKFAESAMRASEYRFSTIFRSSPIAIALTRLADNRLLDVNPAWLELTGNKREDVVGKPIVDLDVWADQKQRNELIAELQSRGRVDRFEVRMKTRSGEVVDLLMSADTVELEGEPYMLSMALDITERKRSEEIKRQLTERIEAGLRAGNISWWEMELPSGKVIFDDRKAEMIGFPPEQFKHYEDFTRLVHPEDRERAMQAMRDCLSGAADRYEVEYRIQTSKKSYLWFRDIGSITEKNDSTGVVRVIGIVQDITQQKLGEELIQQQQETINSIVKTSRDWIWSVDIEGNHTYSNPAIESILGYTPNEIIGMSAFDLLHKEDRKQIEAKLPEWITNKEGWKNLTLRWKNKENEWRWLESNSVPSFDADGNVTGFRGVDRDITERIQAEAALQESRDFFEQLYMQSAISTQLLDPEGWCVKINPKLSEMFGVAPEEIEGKKYNIFKDGEVIRTGVAEKLKRVFEHKETVEWEVHFDIQHASETTGVPVSLGQKKWFQNIAYPIRDADGELEYVIIQHEDVTERKTAEDDLRRSEEKYRDLVENLNDAIFTVALDGTITYLNPAVEQILGYKPEELIGKPYFSVLHPEEKEEVRLNLETLTKTDTLKGELVVLNREGEVRWAYSSIRPILSGDQITGYQGVLTDITERMIASQRVERQLLELRALYENGLAITQTLQPEKIGNILIDTLSKYLNWNHVTIRLREEESDRLLLVAFNKAGLSDDQDSFLAKHFANTISRVGQGLAGSVAKTGEPIRTDEVSSHPEYIETQPGIVSGMYMPIKVGRKVIGVISVESQQPGRFTVDDERLLATMASQAAAAFENARLYQATQLEIAERKQIERELDQERAKLADRVKERTAELVEANMELARANRLKDEFLSTMSHELRTPLNAILSLSESLEEGVYGEVNQDQISTLSIIQESGSDLLTLINDILDISKMEAGKVFLEIVELDIHEICSSAMRLVKQQAFKKEIKLYYQQDPDVDSLEADGRRLKQILVNLLINAVKFTPEGGEIGLEISRDFGGAAVRFSVWDTGIGIKQEDLPRLFQPFVQLDSSLDRRQPGTGLGLALVKKLVEMHGGSVGVESAPGKGSRFFVILPVNFQGGEKSSGKKETSLEETLLEMDDPPKLLAPGYAATILIAEDNFVNYKAVSDYLQSHDYEVIWAANGREAIELAEEFRPDLILMDIQMPELDGLEAIRRLRLKADFAETPIIALTALTMPGDRDRFLEAGADDYMAKPIYLKELILLIRRMLEKDSEG